MAENIYISIVSPVYHAEKIISELVKQIKQNIDTITESYEVILVNDASPDNSWHKIIEECEKDKRIKGINLSRNFGQHYAIAAGLNTAQGEWVVIMDCDLQDLPGEIPNLYRKALEGYDLVFAQRSVRKDSYLKQIYSKSFYALFSYLTETCQDPTVANFGIYNRCVIDAILTMKDQIWFFPAMAQWVGFKRFYLPVQHSNRFEGKTTYRFKDLLRMALNTIIAFSDKPLRITVKIGMTISSISFIVGLIYFIQYSLGKIQIIGFTSLIISIWFLSGIIIMILGILGLYLGKVFEKVKQRPFFIIMDKCNL